MATEYHHGVRVIEINGGVRPIRTVATAVIGVVCTGEDADPALFPLDRPVLLTDVLGAIGKAGTEGTLRATLQAIADQANAITVVVRVSWSLLPREKSTSPSPRSSRRRWCCVPRWKPTLPLAAPSRSSATTARRRCVREGPSRFA